MCMILSAYFKKKTHTKKKWHGTYLYIYFMYTYMECLQLKVLMDVDTLIVSNSIQKTKKYVCVCVYVASKL